MFVEFSPEMAISIPPLEVGIIVIPVTVAAALSSAAALSNVSVEDPALVVFLLWADTYHQYPPNP